MCELFSLSSRLPTRATLSLKTFASHGGFGGVSIDGWGLAFFDGRDVRLYKEPEPAGDSQWLHFIEQRRVASHLILSHIRRATQGPVTLSNTQPFLRELGGRAHVFAHNGRLDDIETRRPGEWRRYRPMGETDSEIAYCILLERLAPLWTSDTVPPLAARLDVVTQFARDMRELGPANFLYADGDALFAHGHRRIQDDGTISPPGLWRLCRRCSGDPDAHTPSAAEDQDLVLVASTPLSEESWTPFAEGEIAVVKDGEILAGATQK